MTDGKWRVFRMRSMTSVGWTVKQVGNTSELWWFASWSDAIGFATRAATYGVTR